MCKRELAWLLAIVLGVWLVYRDLRNDIIAAADAADQATSAAESAQDDADTAQQSAEEANERAEEALDQANRTERSLIWRY